MPSARAVTGWYPLPRDGLRRARSVVDRRAVMTPAAPSSVASPETRRWGTRGTAGATFAGQLTFEHVSRRFGSSLCRVGREPDPRTGRDRLPSRSFRLRQDHAVAHRGGDRPARFRPVAVRRAGDGGASPVRAAGKAQHRADVPGLRPVPAPVHPRQRALRIDRRAKGRSPRHRPQGARSRGAGAIMPKAFRISCRGASSSAWRWPAPWCRGRRCC